MDVNRLRARFIKSQLQRALEASDVAFQTDAARQFRHYTEWFNQGIPEPDKNVIADQLAKLDRKLASTDTAMIAIPSALTSLPDGPREQILRNTFASGTT